MASYGIAVPGTVVPSGSQASPAGAQGIQGSTGSAGAPGANSWTLSSASFTVPAIGSTAVMTVNDTSWAVVGEFVWVATAGGSPTTPMALQITAKTATTLTLLNPPTAGMQVSGDANNLLSLGSDSLAYLPPSAVQPTIWSARLRSFNAIGNPTFEVDQRNVGSATSYPAGSVSRMQVDRWGVAKVGATAVVAANQSGLPGGSTYVVVPGTNFALSSKSLGIQLNTPQASLAAGDYLQIYNYVEGPRHRELINDVHSLQLLAYSSSAISFTVGLLSTSGTIYSLLYLVSIPANTWTLIKLPNCPLWSSSATWSTAPGAVSYQLAITLACGSTYTASGGSGVWQLGTFLALPGTTNFLGLPANSTFYLGFVQHEPGALCTTPIDCPFGENLEGDMGCLRYFQKSYLYTQLPGTSGLNNTGEVLNFLSGNYIYSTGARLAKEMAKSPTMTIYDPMNGAAGSVQDNNGVHHSVTISSGTSSKYPWAILYAAAGGFTAGTVNYAHYTADTGW